jgi:hypothetical protein
MHMDALAHNALGGLLSRLGLVVVPLEPDQPIPGSYWGAPEAGIIGNHLYVRPDTPVHSALHTACHFICMDDARRVRLHTDCGGTDEEEGAVCYLQCVLADALPGYSRARLWADMDAWGYSFRLGSAQRWFEEDAADAREWLVRHGLLTAQDEPTGRWR